MKNGLIALCMIAGVGLACATQKATINTFVDPAYSSGSIQCVAIFPMRNTSLAPSEAQQVNRKVAQAVQGKNASIQLLGPAEATQALNDKGVADTWASFLDSYTVSGIPDHTRLSDVGDALNCNGIIQGELVNIHQQDGEYGGNAGMTRVTVRFTMLDTDSGKLVWEASSDGIRKTATTVGQAPPLIEAINLAVDKILQNLPAL